MTLMEECIHAQLEEKRKKKEATELQKKKMAERLKETIWESGMSQSEFSRKCHISHETLRKYIYGEHFIRVDMLIPIAQQLDVSFEYLLCLDDEKNSPIREKISNETNLSENAISNLLSLRKDKVYTTCISTILENKPILDTFVKYYSFLNKTEKANYPSDYGDIEIDNIYLYQMMKEMEKAVKGNIDMDKGGN